MVVHGAKLSFLQHKIYVYELWTGLYMLEPWEKTLFNTATHHVPVIRHLWGDPQYEVHPGGQELFLDLIFVGVRQHRSLEPCQTLVECPTLALP